MSKKKLKIAIQGIATSFHEVAAQRNSKKSPAFGGLFFELVLKIYE